METIYLDAENAILGRIGSFASKELLKGKSVIIVNSEKAIISGSKKDVVDKIMDMRKRGGSSRKGPKIPKTADRFLKRKLRGMLPWKSQRGRDAYKRLRCYIGNNLTQNESKKLIKFESMPIKYVSIHEILKLI